MAVASCMYIYLLDRHVITSKCNVLLIEPGLPLNDHLPMYPYSLRIFRLNRLQMGSIGCTCGKWVAKGGVLAWHLCLSLCQVCDWPPLCLIILSWFCLVRGKWKIRFSGKFKSQNMRHRFFLESEWLPPMTCIERDSTTFLYFFETRVNNWFMYLAKFAKWHHHPKFHFGVISQKEPQNLLSPRVILSQILPQNKFDH